MSNFRRAADNSLNLISTFTSDGQFFHLETAA